MRYHTHMEKEAAKNLLIAVAVSLGAALIVAVTASHATHPLTRKTPLLASPNAAWSFLRLFPCWLFGEAQPFFAALTRQFVNISLK